MDGHDSTIKIGSICLFIVALLSDEDEASKTEEFLSLFWLIRLPSFFDEPFKYLLDNLLLFLSNFIDKYSYSRSLRGNTRLGHSKLGLFFDLILN